jgi:hypothetical protein
MTDQIEKIRAEFESEIHKVIPALNLIWDDKTGQYYPFDTQIAWLSWQAAKRNMPVVELPKPELCFTSSPSGHGAFAYVQLEPLIERLEKAGIEWISENPYSAKG